MRRLLLTATPLIAALLGAAASDARSTPRQPASTCVKPSARAVDGAKTIGPRKLGEMPPAKQYLAVVREIDGCPRPVVLREVQPAR